MKKIYKLLCIATFLVLSQVNGFGQTFSPVINATGVSQSPTLSITFAPTDVVTLNNDKNIFISTPAPDYTTIVSLYTGKTGKGGTPRDSRITISNNVITFNLSGTTLAPLTQYLIWADLDAILVNGIPWNYIYDDIWFITTGAPPSPPTITTFSPTHNLTTAPVDADIVLTFSEAIKYAEGFSTIRLYNASNVIIVEASISGGAIVGGPTGGTMTILGNDLTINPTSDLIAGVGYYLVIGSSAIEASSGGSNFAGLTATNFADAAYKFTTYAPPPPTISSYSPLNGSTTVTKSQNLILTFNENIAAGSSGRFYIYNSSGVEFISFPTVHANVNISGATLTVTHSDFVEGATYYVIIDAGYVKSAATGANFGGISDVNQWRFTTALPIPTTTFYPLNGATGTGVDIPLTATYDVAIRMTDGTIITDANVASLITLKNLGVDIPFTASINAAKTIITVTPDSNLPSLSLIDFTVLAVENSATGGEQTITQITSFTTDDYDTWTGAISRDWATGGNWASGTVPVATSVIIPEGVGNTPNIATSNASVNNCTIGAGMQIDIAATRTLQVSKSLVLKSSNTASVGNANLLNNGTLTIQPGATVDIQQKLSTTGKGYYISSPVAGATQNNTGITDEIYKRNATTASWNVMSPSETMNAGQGYITYGYAGDIIHFKGAVNNANSYPFAAVRQASPNNYGWNLAGNPYPCSIDFDLCTKSPEMDNVFYLFNEHLALYGSYNGESHVGTNVNPTYPSHIPSLHSFWVQVNLSQTNGTFTVPKTARVSSNYTFLKAGKATNPQIRLAGINSLNTADEFVAIFLPAAKEEGLFDVYDTEKKFTAGTAALELFSVHETSGKFYAIDGYPSYAPTRSIPLAFNAKNTGNYRIKLLEVLNFTDNIKIEIEDKLNATFNELSVNDEYLFTTTGSTTTNKTRFVLHITKLISTDISKITPDNKCTVYNKNQDIYINVRDLNAIKYELYNVSGTKLQEGTIESGHTNQVHSPYKGVVLVKIITKERSETHKLLIK